MFSPYFMTGTRLDYAKHWSFFGLVVSCAAILSIIGNSPHLRANGPGSSLLILIVGAILGTLIGFGIGWIVATICLISERRQHEFWRLQEVELLTNVLPLLKTGVLDRFDIINVSHNGIVTYEELRQAHEGGSHSEMYHETLNFISHNLCRAGHVIGSHTESQAHWGSKNPFHRREVTVNEYGLTRDELGAFIEETKQHLDALSQPTT